KLAVVTKLRVRDFRAVLPQRTTDIRERQQTAANNIARLFRVGKLFERFLREQHTQLRIRTERHARLQGQQTRLRFVFRSRSVLAFLPRVKRDDEKDHGRNCASCNDESQQADAPSLLTGATGIDKHPERWTGNAQPDESLRFE